MISQRWLSLVCALVFVIGPKAALWASPQILEFEPKSGLEGTPVVIFGEGLATANRVLFNGVDAQFSVDVLSGTITAVVPLGAVTGRILVFTPDGFGASNENFVIGELGPEIVSFTPQGPIGADVVLVLNLALPIMSVDFNGIQAPFTPVSDTLILTRVPNGATSGPITATFDGGSASSDGSFTVTQLPVQGLPTITGFVPTEGSIGREVLITGINLSDGVLAIQFGGVTAKFVQRADGILATVPVSAQTGAISVITLQGLGTSSNPFVVRPQPEILRFDPTSGAAGTPVEIFGLEINDATAVFFNGVPAQFELNTATGSLIALVPSGAENGAITVTTPSGTAVSSGTFVSMESQKITAYTPSGNSGATIVLVLSTLVSATRVEFNGVGAPFSQIPLDSGSLILTWVPDNATSGPISVFFPDSSAAVVDSFTVTQEASARIPSISKFSPNEAAVGAQVLISGANLVGEEVLAVQFNGISASFIQAPEGILANVPVGARSGTITVITLYGVARPKDPFVLGPPDLPPSQTFKVYWDREACLGWDVVSDPAIGGHKLYLSDSQRQLFFITDIPNDGTATTCGNFDLRSVLPSNGTYSAYLTAYNFAHQESEPSDRIYFELLPSVDSVSTTGGYVEDNILISGAGFVDITEVRFGGIQAQYKVLSPTQIEAEVPLMASSGPVEVVTSAGSIVTANDFRVLPSYDLILTQTGLAQGALTGTELTYTALIQNRGPVEAENVVLSMKIPPEIQRESVSVDGVPIVLAGSDLVVNLGPVPSGALVRVATKLKLGIPGLYSLASSVRSDGTDRNLANNTMSERFEVFPIPALSIRSLGDGQLELSWPATGDNFKLESMTLEGISHENWQPVAIEPFLLEGSYIVILPSGKSHQLFRLRAINR